jgi:tetratricopeptide (TPR) repeat protein
LFACANPLNQITYERYRDQAREAERRGDLAAAEEAYYRAAMNVQWGHLGENAEEESLYNLGRTKRLVGKLDESEDVLKRALAIDEKRGGPEHIRTIGTKLELATTYFEAKKYEQGTSLLLGVEPIVLKYNQAYPEQAHRFIKTAYEKYAAELSKQGKPQEAERFKKAADAF